MSSSNGSVLDGKSKKSTNKFKLPANEASPEPVTAKQQTIASKPTQSDENNFQTKIYDAFLKLSQFNTTVRFEGIRQITSYYNALDIKQNKTHNDYILNRLIKGLASNRKCSRLGFSCTLTELFNRHDTLQFQSVLEIANKHLKLKLREQKSNEKNTLTKEEMRHMKIGFAFVYIAYIQSTRIDNIDENDKSQLELITSLATDLNGMRKNKEIKPYIQQIYLQALILLIKKISSEKIFQDHILVSIAEDLEDNLLLTNFCQTSDNPLVETSVKNDFNLLLACLNSYPNVVRHKLLEANDLDLKKNIFSAESYNRIFEFISQSTESLPKIQPFCIELIEFLVTQEPLIAKEIWIQLIDGKLCPRREPEKKYLSYKLLLCYLSLTNKSNFKIIFNECVLKSLNVIQSLVYNYLNRWSNLNKICRDVMKELIDLLRVKETEFSEFSETCAPFILKCLKHTRNHHDISDFFSAALVSLNKHGLEVIYKHLTTEFANKASMEEEVSMELGLNPSETSKEEAENIENKERSVNRHMWITNQLFSMSKNDAIFKSETLIKDVLGYLLVNAYFETADKAKEHNKYLIKVERSEKLETHIRDTLLRYVGVLLAKNSPEFNDRIIDLIQHVQDFLESKSKQNLKISADLVEKVSEYKSLSCTTIKILSDLNSKYKVCLKKKNKQEKTQANGFSDENTNCDVVQTFFMVTTFEFFKMFDSFKSSKRVIFDLEICIRDYSENAKGIEPNKTQDVNDENGEAQKPDWIDMLVETLLNLLTINKAWIRACVKSQFKKLIPKLTYNSVKLIVDLLEIEAENELLMEDEMDTDDDYDSENEISEVEEDVKDSTMSNKGQHNGGLNGKKSESEEDSNKSNEEDDTDDGSENSTEKMNDIRLNESLNKIIAGQLDEENQSDSDLDDETMMQMDKKLVDAFKLRQAERKTDNSKIEYKLKALDLIQELFKTTYRLDLINNLIKPMLNILFESQKKPNLKSISQRILGFLVSFKNNLKLLNESRLPLVEEVFDTLSYIIECSITHFNVINTLVETTMFCVKVILFISEKSTGTEQQRIVKKLNNTYIEMIKNEKSKINPLMYKQFLIRFPDQSIPLIIQIIDTVNSSEVKVFKKTSALITLNPTINNQLFMRSDDQTKMFRNRIFAFLESIMDEIMKNENLNLKFVDAFLNLTNRVLNLQKHLIKKEFCESLAAKATAFVNKEAKMKQTHKSRFMNLIHRCEIIRKNTS